MVLSRSCRFLAVKTRSRASGRSVRVSPRGYACRHRVRSRFGWVRLLILIGSERVFLGGGGRRRVRSSGDSVEPFTTVAYLSRARGGEIHRANVSRDRDREVVHPAGVGRHALRARVTRGGRVRERWVM